MTTQDALGVIAATINYLVLMLDASGADCGEACLIEQLERVEQFLRTGSS
jgi:hypothetical protein